MLISGMNRYFAKHGKITFGIIAIIISVSFVLYLSRVSVFDLFKSRGPKAVSILGRDVSAKERIEVAKKMVLFAALGNPLINLKRLPIDPNSQFVTTDIVQFYAATDLGIRVGDKSIVEYIKAVPAFQTQRHFDIKKYNDFVKNRLAPAHFSKTDLDEAVRHEMTVERLRNAVLFNILTTQNELRTAYDSAHQKAKAEVIWFSGANFADKVVPKDQDVKNYFDSHRKEYVHPAKAKAKLIPFPYAKYRAAAVKSVTTKTIEDYYQKNRFMYLREGQNSKNGGPVYKPLAEVSNKIRASLVEQQTKALAFKDATKFSDNLYSALEDVFYHVKNQDDAREKCLALFDKLVAKANLKVQESGWVAMNSGDNLAKALAELRTDSPVSEPIRESDAIIVAFLLDKQPAKPKTFEEAEKAARAGFIRTRSIILAREAARAATTKLAKSLESGTDFQKALKNLNLKAESLPEIGVSLPPQCPYGALVSQTIFETPAKSVSQARTTDNGAFIVYVESRRLPTDKDFENGIRMSKMFYEMSKKQSVYKAFLQSLMAASASGKE